MVTMLPTIMTISLTPIHDVKMTVTTSWKRSFRGHLIITPSLVVHHYLCFIRCIYEWYPKSIVWWGSDVRNVIFSRAICFLFALINVSVFKYIYLLNGLVNNWRRNLSLWTSVLIWPSYQMGATPKKCFSLKKCLILYTSLLKEKKLLWYNCNLYLFHMGIRDMYIDRNKIIKVLPILNEGIYLPIIICITWSQSLLIRGTIEHIIGVQQLCLHLKGP